MIEVRELDIPGVLEIVPSRITDPRGYFVETFNRTRFAAIGLNREFVQDNHSLSTMRGTLRGLHYQLEPHAQDKLVRVVRGVIFDVAVDVRRSSPFFGKWVALEVSAERGNQLFVPRGFAHGFVTLVPDTEVIYKVTDLYAPRCDRSIRFDDPEIAIDWPLAATVMQLSDKDAAAPKLSQAEVFE